MNAKADCQQLVEMVLPLAKLPLEDQGALLPFAGTMKLDGEIISVSGTNGEEQPRPTDILRLLKGGLQDFATDGEHKATALAYDVRIRVPSSNQKSDAICVDLDHRDRYSVRVIFPYRFIDGILIVDKPFAMAGAADIFPQR